MCQIFRQRRANYPILPPPFYSIPLITSTAPKTTSPPPLPPRKIRHTRHIRRQQPLTQILDQRPPHSTGSPSPLPPRGTIPTPLPTHPFGGPPFTPPGPPPPPSAPSPLRGPRTPASRGLPSCGRSRIRSRRVSDDEVRFKGKGHR